MLLILLFLQTNLKKKDVKFLLISGLIGINIETRTCDKSVCSRWSNGTIPFEVLDGLEVGASESGAPLRLPIIDKFKDMGSVIVMGKWGMQS